MTVAIKTQDLTKYYGNTRGIEHLNLDIHEGEIFGFLGPNGAGKTTTIRVLLGLIRKTGGQAELFGLDHETHFREIRQRLAYLPGELGLYSEKTGRQNLKYLLGLYDREVRWARVEELAERVSLNLDRKVKELSKGNKQKVGLVLALAPETDLLVLDEPTSGLDPLMQLEFYKIVHEQQRESGCTVFLSSHLLPEVERVANRVGIIREGTLVEVSSVSALKKMTLKRVEVIFDASDRARQLQAQLPTNIVQNVTEEDGHLHFLCPVVDLPTLMDSLKASGFADLSISSPALEDIFLKYYDTRNPESKKTTGGTA